MNRERRRHPISEYLPFLNVSKKAVIPSNELSKGSFNNSKGKSASKKGRIT